MTHSHTSPRRFNSLASPLCHFSPPLATQQIRCHYCHVWGHVLRDCLWKKRVDRLWQQSPSAFSVVALDALPALVPLAANA